ncbi:TPA: MobA/MobL family protein, partial [Clostridioides difficile]|nr:MobA/MobL family protein [Clostridioides difficile]
MAIYHLHTKIISRSKGKSSVGASAYRSSEKLYNERDGLEHDYTRKKGVVYKEILAPQNAPKWATHREKLWNEVEKVEKSKNSQLAREIDVALPIELSLEKQINLLRDYVQDIFVNKGMVADFVIHDKKDG